MVIYGQALLPQLSGLPARAVTGFDVVPSISVIVAFRAIIDMLKSFRHIIRTYSFDYFI